MSNKKLNYLVTQPYVNCNILTNNQIKSLLGAIEKQRIILGNRQFQLRKVGKYQSADYVVCHDRLLHYHQDTVTLINLIKVAPFNIGLSSTSTTQIYK